MIRLSYEKAKGCMAGKLSISDESGILYAIDQVDKRAKHLKYLTVRQIRFLAKMLLDEAETLQHTRLVEFGKDVILIIPRNIHWLKQRIAEADGRKLPLGHSA